MLKKLMKGNTNNLIRKRQLITAGIIFGGVLGLSALILAVLNSDEPTFTGGVQQIDATNIESSGQRTNAEEMWRYQMEEENKRMANELVKIQQNQQSSKDDYARTLEEQIKTLESRLSPQMNLQTSQQTRGESSSGEVFPPIGEFGSNSIGPSAPIIQKISISLTPLDAKPLKEEGPIKTVDNTIPAGSFAKAVLLSGVDASAAMNATSDPRPMLLRIVDPGRLPRRFKSDLEDCHCTASAYGDISSERVYARLEKLTCTERLTGEIIETQVAGYVAGPDGRAGIRGAVVAKDSAFLARSLVGGVFAGLSNISSPQRQQDYINPFSAGNPKIDAPSKSELFKSGVAEGGASALDRLSKYYIERAEQLQPVIQVSAGQEVDIVFTEGTAIGDTNVKREIAKVRDAARRRAAIRASKEDTGIN